MIRSYQDYIYYLKEDLATIGLKKSIKNILFSDFYKFYKILRYYEYLNNCNGNKLLLLITKYRFKRITKEMGFSFGINTFGPGLSIGHYGTIVVHSDTRIGKNCRLNVCVNIGSVYGKKGLPIIGDNVYIGPGVKMYGPIVIGDNVSIGANAVVNSSFPDGNCTIAGVPAKIVSKNNYKKYLENQNG